MTSNVDVEFSYLKVYKEPPEGTCNLSELEIFCKERLQLYDMLMKAENLNLKRHANDWTEYLNETIENSSFLESYKILLGNIIGHDIIRAQRKDHLAHWFLSICTFLYDVMQVHSS